MNQEVPNLNDVDTRAGFSYFDAGLTEQDQEILAKINVGTKGVYDNFGDIDKIKADAAELFENLGNSPAAAKAQAEIIARMAKRAIAGFGSEAAWVTIRAFRPTDEFDIPRWHTDREFFGTKGYQLKAVFALKGASTLLHRADEDQRREITKLQRAASVGEMDEIESRTRREALLDLSKTETPPPGTGTILIAGGDHATVHSEPPIREARIFLSVLPGTKAEIKQLQQNWDRGKKTEIRLGDQKPAKTNAHRL